jgi:hypothetical protein
MQRIIFGPEKEEVRRRWIKVHNEVFHGFYSAPDIIKEIESGGGGGGVCGESHVTRTRWMINKYKVLVGTTEGK